MATANYNDPSYDYTKYWQGRDYENKAETLAIQKFLPKKAKNIIDVGGGFGRLIPVYKDNFDEITLFDFSDKILNQSKGFLKSANLQDLKVELVQGDVYELSKRTNKKYDCLITVRVAHHLAEIEKGISEFSKVLNKDGILIMEFANKMHFKSVLVNLLKLNFGYFGKNHVSRTTNDVTFLNFHPDKIAELLKENGFEIQDKLSVSNFRLGFLKDVIPESILLTLENILQKPLAYLNFGPSIFIKAIKK